MTSAFLAASGDHALDPESGDCRFFAIRSQTGVIGPRVEIGLIVVWVDFSQRNRSGARHDMASGNIVGGIADHIHPEPQGFIRRYVFSLDHKIIGIQYIITAFVFFVLGGLLAEVIRISRVHRERRLLRLS